MAWQKGMLAAPTNEPLTAKPKSTAILQDQNTMSSFLKVKRSISTEIDRQSVDPGFSAKRRAIVQPTLLDPEYVDMEEPCLASENAIAAASCRAPRLSKSLDSSKETELRDPLRSSPGWNIVLSPPVPDFAPGSCDSTGDVEELGTQFRDCFSITGSKFIDFNFLSVFNSPGEEVELMPNRPQLQHFFQQQP